MRQTHRLVQLARSSCPGPSDSSASSSLAHFVLAWAIERGSRPLRRAERAGHASKSATLASRSWAAACRSATSSVANPQSPLRNLVEADHCDLEVEPDALLHKQTVVRYGTVTGLRFGTPATTSGALPGVESPPPNPRSTAGSTKPRPKPAHDWLDRLNKKLRPRSRRRSSNRSA